MMNIFSFDVENLRLWLTWELSASSLFFLFYCFLLRLTVAGWKSETEEVPELNI